MICYWAIYVSFPLSLCSSKNPDDTELDDALQNVVSQLGKVKLGPGIAIILEIVVQNLAYHV